ncbi:MAG: alpha/beta hydrolase [Lachnospiraceae bacterium]|nr:alpha/beta hydrolase [Lachnospiraceae bacterium]
MCLGFSYIGLIWLIMLFVPNFIWAGNKPQDYDKYVVNENKGLLALERAGQFTVTPVALIFSDFNYKGWNFWVAVLLLSFLCMALYEIFWIRYFKSEKTMKDFYRGILGIPVAGASLPVVAFFLLGIYGGNILMIIGSVILGIGHIGIHLQHRKEVYGPRQKKKLPLRIIFGICKTLGVLIALIVCGLFTFFIAGRNINQLKRHSAYQDGVNEQIYVKLTDQEGYITIAGKKISNPVIISLHGGPGAPTTFIDYCWQDYLTDDYTVISWDERGCGRSYYRNASVDPDNETLTFDSQLADLDALVDYARERFAQEKVIILGHSYGTMLGSRYVIEHPEKVSAYIGVGQCVNERDYFGETYSYEDALAIARERGDDTTELMAAYDRFLADKSIQNLLQLRSLVDPYHPQTVTEDVSTMAALTSPIAGVDDFRWYMIQIGASMGGTRYEKLVEKPLSGYMMDFNALERKDVYQMPVLLLSGSCDWICPVGLVEDYMDVLTAPRKELQLLEGCGHSPQGQLPEAFCQVVKDFLEGIFVAK